MRILITNDDGINSDGLIRLAKAAKRFGEVFVVAPDGQRSAFSHSINLRAPIDMYEVKDFPVDGVKAFKSTGTPADCVRVGFLNIMEGKADLLFSGINYGFNVASDLQYSATAGAAFEGSFQGIKSIAFSEGIKLHEATDVYLEQVIEKLLPMELGCGQIFNVNFPDCKANECKGILFNRAVSCGMIYKDTYDAEPLEDGGIRYTVVGNLNVEYEAGTDYCAVYENYVSVGVVNNLN